MSNPTELTFEKRASDIRTAIRNEVKDPVNGDILKAKGEMPRIDYSSPEAEGKSTAVRRALQTSMLSDMKTVVQSLDAQRQGSQDKRPVDISFSEFAHKMWGFAASENTVAESFFRAIGIEYGTATLDLIMNMADMTEGYRWLVPEIIREAIRLGLRKPAFYPNVLAAEENISQPTINMPFINMSDAMPTKLGEAETIPTGMLSFGQRSIKLQKLGVGIKMTDEVMQYATLPLLAIFLQDMGVKLNLGLDVMAIDVLINGDGNSNAAPVIGVVDNTKGIQYYDLLRTWIRMGLLGRQPQSILSNETVAIATLMLPEFTNTTTLLAALQPRVLNPRTPLPSVQNYDIHGAFPAANQAMLIDSSSALIKFNSAALRMENSRIAEKQISGTYATVTTGFANLLRDGRIIIDGSLVYGSYPFPSWMDAGAVQAAGSFRTF